MTRGGSLMKRFIEEYAEKEFDLVIVGGGITGAAVAYDAAGRGLSVALVEKGDFGSATSSATSKMIHGGLRYLATGEFGLVRESLRERRILENIAPNFVYPMPVMFTSSDSRLSNNKWFIEIGMILYDILSLDKGRTWDKSKKLPMHRMVSRNRVLKMEPNVKKEGLTGAAMYHDCVSISPERLTLAFIKSAVKYGAQVSNYTKAVDFLSNGRDGDHRRITGIRVKDLIKNKEHDIRGKLVINCGGPWADILLHLAGGKKADEKLRRSEGIHIITKKLINDHIVGSTTAAGKHFFLIPWRNHSLIGTTDTEYIGSPDEYRVTRKSIEALISEVNESFGDGSLIQYDDILYTYGGLRPLVEDQTEDVYESSRKYEIYDNKKDGLDGLVTVEGGKYTTSRKLAGGVMKTVQKKMGKKIGREITAEEYLAGSEIPDMEMFVLECKKKYNGFRDSHVEYLSRIYGRELDAVMAIAGEKKEWAAPLNGDGEMLAQVIYAIRNEMALTLKDIIFRRTGLGTLGHPGDTVLKKIADTAARELKWDEKRKKTEIKEVLDQLRIPE